MVTAAKSYGALPQTFFLTIATALPCYLQLNLTNLPEKASKILLSKNSFQND